MLVRTSRSQPAPAKLVIENAVAIHRLGVVLMQAVCRSNDNSTLHTTKVEHSNTQISPESSTL